jgi:CTP synthase (UTP-ammonia lyase)
VLGLAGADHEESAPGASLLLISKLSCSLVGQHKPVRFSAGSQIHRIYGADTAVEEFACNYGFNEAFAGHFDGADLRMVARDEDGTARVVELPSHRFFIATLYVPQVLSRPGAPHPLIAAYLQAARL